MILSKLHVLPLALGAAGVLPVTAVGTNADEYVRSSIQPIAARCARFGTDFTDAGNGVCRRVAGHVRVYVRIPSAGLVGAPLNGWGAGTSSAALRSYEPSMVPGAATTQHLRIRAPLDSAGFYR